LQPSGKAVLTDVAVIVEHGPWLADQPGTGTCVETSGLQTGWEEFGEGSFAPTISTDDCWVGQDSVSISTAGNDLFFGSYTGPDTADCGIRFRNVTVPSGATISKAWITFTASEARSETTINLTIDGEDNASPAVFSTVADFNGRVRTTASVSWNNVAAWSIDVEYDSPEIKTVVQEIVDLDAWDSGDNMVIFINDNSSTLNAYRAAYSLDEGSGKEPVLHIEYFVDDSATFGRAATCDNEVYVANKHNEAQLTHIYRYDSGTVTFGPNIVNSTAFSFWQDLIGSLNIGDIQYFGIDSSLTDSGPFASLVFDIDDENRSGSIISVWEYWNGAAWGALTVGDNTAINAPFEVSGVGSVHWAHPSNWATTAINGVTAYWVRVRVTNIQGLPGEQLPTHHNRKVYTITWPYFDMDELQIAGDLTALARTKLTSWSGSLSSPSGQTGKIHLGLRSVERGSDFTSYLNYSDEQMPLGVSVAVTGGAAIANRVQAPSGRALYCTASGTSTITVTGTYSNQYYGQYNVFLRCYQVDGSAGDVSVKLTSGFKVGTLLTTLSETDTLVTGNTNDFQLINFGQISLPGGPVTTRSDEIPLNLLLTVTFSGTVTEFYVYDLILIPVDEWSGVFHLVYDGSSAPGMLAQNGDGQYLDVDSISIPKQTLSSMIRTTEASQENDVDGYFTPFAVSQALLQANKDQRMWVLTETRNSASDPDDLTAGQYMAHSIQEFVNQRYFTMRGDR
jgi:hypothetical protein